MKILRLDLLAFGPFTNTTLELDQGNHGLHLVCGPNEAGKSSALRGLQQVLYGIPTRSTDNFLHPHTKMRIGALLENGAGEQIECIRRKGRSKTLRAANDTDVIDESILSEMLGPIDDKKFNQQFGIDYQELSEGGRAMVDGSGDLGEILFAAAAGIPNLSNVQEQLKTDMVKLFRPSGSNPQINSALVELQHAKTTITESLVTTSEWASHDEALSDALRCKMEIEKELKEIRTEKSRLERIYEALHLVSQRGPLQTEHAEAVDVPLLPDDFTDDRRETTEGLQLAKRKEQDAADSIAQLEKAIKQFESDLPEGLLEHSEVIGQLQTELGSFQKAEKRRPALKLEQEQLEDQSRAVLKDLGHEPELDQADRFKLSTKQRQRIVDLANHHQAVLAEHAFGTETLEKIHRDIARCEEELADMPEMQDAGRLLQAIQRAVKEGDPDKRLSALQADLRQLQEQADIDLQQIQHWTGSLADFEKLAIPSVETIDRFEEELAAARTAATHIQDFIETCSKEAKQVDQDLESLQLEQDVPTENDLSEAREQRDAGWRLVRDAWLDQVDNEEGSVRFIAAHEPEGDLPSAYERSVEEADQVSDRLRREAKRVEKKATLTARHLELARHLAELQDNLLIAEQDVGKVEEDWQQQWASAGINPDPPREMRTWTDRRNLITQSGEEIRSQQHEVEITQKLIDEHRAKLNECLVELGQPASSDDSLAGVIDQCEQLAEKIASDAHDRVQLIRDLKKLRTEEATALQVAEQATETLDQWQTDWVAAIQTLGIVDDATPSEVNTILVSLDDLFAKLKEAKDRRQEIVEIDLESNGYTDKVHSLVERIADDLSELPTEQAVADLSDRLRKANTTQAQLDDRREQLELATMKHEKAHAEGIEWQIKIDMFCKEAMVESPDDLPDAERRSDHRRELEKDLRRIEKELTMKAAGQPLEDFVTDALELNPDEIEPDIEQLNEKIDELEIEMNVASEKVGSETKSLKLMDGSGKAAIAQEQAEHLLAQIRNDSEQYARLRLASVVLGRAIQRFREKSQGPVLDRASRIFSDLTLGSFNGLRLDYNEKGDPALVGVRTGIKQPVGVHGMSDGTADQLYLALRLALLQLHLESHDRVPLIVDDILIKFDDARSAATLKTLAELSKQTQVILFTHHRHLKDLAKKTIADDVLFIHDFGYAN